MSTQVKTQVVHAFVPKAPVEYEHDADGNMRNDGRFEFAWDGENRLVRMETSSSVTSSGVPRQAIVPVYDWQHRRVSKTVSNWNASSSLWTLASSLRFAYQGWNVAAEYDRYNNLTKSHTWGNDLSGSMQGAGGVGGLLMTTFHTGI